MLCQLTIHNIALIERLTIEFTKGLNVLTGETGAGKSIVIDAVNLALGERADRELIRAGQAKATVEALFDIGDCARALEMLQAQGVETEENQLIVSREMTQSGRNVARVNGTLCPLTFLRRLTGLLVDVHGQHEHQALLDESQHLSFLDGFGAGLVEPEKAKLRALYQSYRERSLHLKRLVSGAQQRAQRLDMLSFQVQEIAAARLQPGEEEALASQRDVYRNAERIATALAQANAYLSGYEEGFSSVDGVRQALGRLEEISRFSPEYARLAEGLKDAFYTLEDLAEQVRDEAEGLEFDPRQAERAENRLETIKSLKRKYGADIGEILAYQRKAEQEIASLTYDGEDLESLEQSCRDLAQRLYAQCLVVHQLRGQLAERLSTALLAQLSDLGMAHARFQVEFAPLPPDPLAAQPAFSAEGLDQVRFMLSANRGEPLKPLSRTASGGELSRIMLAFKAISAGVEEVGSMVFDEIDTGISGRMAQVVGEKMAAIGRSRQVICVTHLPQIAALGDSHQLVEKYTNNERTYTRVTPLTEEGRVKELARMVGGAAQTAGALAHAREMLELAKARRSGA